MPEMNKKGKKSDDDNDNEEVTLEPFETIRDEADHFLHVSLWKRAVKSYTKALELRPEDKHCLVSRSRCYLKLGDSEKALEDAEKALEEDKDFPKGLHMKAEALYGKGDFETALVYFHRAHRLRGEMDVFRLGIQKCKEAIENSVGDPQSIKLQTVGDLSHFARLEEEEERRKRGKKTVAKGYSKPGARKEEDPKKRKERKAAQQDDKTIKQLLGELYSDRKYLEFLLEKEICKKDTATAKDVHDLVVEALNYLDTRTEFWQQEKPLYARKRDRELQRRGSRGSDINRRVMDILEQIDEDQENGQYEVSLRKALKLEKQVLACSDSELQNKSEILGSLYSFIGNAHLELGNYDDAFTYHNKDKDIAVENKLEDSKSRASDNIGRVHARRGEFDKAIAVWEEKVPMAKSALEKAWLHHEIGRCYYEKENCAQVLKHGEKSLTYAREAEDKAWQLNATVLLALAYSKNGDLEESHDYFEQGLEMAHAQGDKAAEDSIRRALEDVKKNMVLGMKADEDTSLTDDWAVAIHTADKLGAGTDSKVFLTLVGSKTSSERIILDSDASHFEKGNCDTFTITTQRIGQLESIKLGQDGTGSHSDWDLDKVIIKNKRNGNNWLFEYDDCIKSGSVDEDIEIHGQKTSRTSQETEEDMTDGHNDESYKVSITTSDNKGSGTDANVYLTIFGEDATSSKLACNSKGDCFEAGQTDEFFFETKKLGKLTKIILGHDNSGRFCGWHCAKVVIEHIKSGTVTSIPVNRWFDEREDDKKIEREILADTVHPLSPKETPNSQFWTIRVHTSDIKGAGTDANVYIFLIGQNGRTDKMFLKSETSSFEGGKCDSFGIQTKHIGELQKIRIGHDNKGGFAGWHLDKVEISSKNQEDRMFPCSKWLDKREGDKKIERELIPGVEPDLASPTKLEKILEQGQRYPVKANPPRNKKETWTIKTFTTDKKGAGIESAAHIVLMGSEKSSKKIELKPKGKGFQRGACDIFRIETDAIGDLEKIKIGQDGKDPWHLAKVIVQGKQSGSKTFPCGEWVKKSGGGEKEKDKWKIRVTTSDKKAAGTDANVYVVLKGEKSESSRMYLDNVGNDFEQGKTNEFEVKPGDIGAVESLKIGHDNNGALAGWHLNKVEVEDPKHKVKSFPCDMWLDSKKDDKKIERELFPAGQQEKKTEKTESKKKNEEQWTVKVHTSDVKGAGTDANVYVTLIGKEGQSEKVNLDSKDNNFETGACDVFDIKTKHIGELEKVKIGHDNKGGFAGWHLDKVEVQHKSQGTKVFPCNRWLDKREDDKKIERELTPGEPAKAKASKKESKSVKEKASEKVESSKKKDEGTEPWTVKVYTSDLRGAGTDSNVYIVLMGKEGSTDKIPLDGKGDNFESGKCDVFDIKTKAIGDLQKIKIGHDNKGGFGGWHLDRVEMSHKSQGTKIFPCNRWLDKREDDKKLERELVPGKAKTEDKKSSQKKDKESQKKESGSESWKVRVHTSKIKGAGTDANVYIVLIGKSGTTDKLPLDGDGNNFETGKCDSFEVNSKDIGELKKIKIGHDNKGGFAGWHLEKVEVQHKTHGTKIFPCNRWLDKKEDDKKIERELSPGKA